MDTISKEIDMRRYAAAAVAVLVLLAATSALSNSYNAPTIDGHVTTQEGDWETDELAWRDPNNDNRWGPSDGDLVDLYVTWDADSLYVGVKTVNGPSGYGNGYLVFIDTDAQNGITGATEMTAADYFQRQIEFGTIGADVMMGMWNFEPGNHGVRDCSDPTSTVVIDESYVQINPGFKHIEFGIDWNGIFGLGRAAVPPGTTLRIICAVVGGDGSGAYDALPTSSTGVESNASTEWNAITDLDIYVEFPVDADGDGVPDECYPPCGRISGTVTLDDLDDDTTRVTVTAYQNGEAVWSGRTPPGGGDYTIERLADGEYDVTATAVSYLPETETGVIVADGGETTGVDFALMKVTGRIEGEVAITGGPDVDVTVGVYDTTTGELGGDGEAVIEGGTGAFSIGTVVDGTWLVLAEGKGYVEADTMATITDGDTTSVGLLTLPVVVATKYGFSDSLGNSIYGAGTTVSLPDSGIYYYAHAWVEPRDDGDRVAYWDYDAQGGIVLSATKLDPAYDPSGTVVFADTSEVPLLDATLTSDMFDDGRAPFLTADDVIEVVRVFATNAALRDTLQGVLEVGIAPPAAVRLALSTDMSTIAAGVGVATISGQLLDASNNAAQVPGIIANMTASGVGGGFSVPSPETDADGKFAVDFSGTVTGTTYVSAAIDPGSAYPNLEVDELTIEITPDVAAFVEIEPDPRALRAGDLSTLSAQVVDAWGNNVALGDLSIALAASPPLLLASIDSPIVTDGTGWATGDIEAGSTYGTVEISGAATGIEVETIYVPIDATIKAMDEVAPETDPDHNSDEGLDLTVLRISNSADELIIGLILDSEWNGAHLGICIEANGDAAGATLDPFVFPINYGHALLPDYAFVYKFYDRSYADFRRWNVDLGLWQWQDWDTGEWLTDYDDNAGIPAQERQMDHDQWDVYFRIPLSTIGVSVGDTVRVQGYTMQEVPGDPDAVKYAALDSAPHDATHDMLPDVGDWWDTATNTVTLSNYQTYVLRAEGLAPVLSDGEADPSPAQPGDLVTYTVQVTDTGGGIGDVFLNLSDIGGDRFVRMADDGVDPDAAAGDGVYTASDVLSSSASDGDHTVTVTARDGENIAAATLDIDINANNPATAIRQFDDPEFDDHGPNG
ncbi:carboxypeptidase regulatory-like domain-containing protein, partial [bacterium]|nr:carboxypeptidase regulatory-like domain-containing protein [bacterium]